MFVFGGAVVAFKMLENLVDPVWKRQPGESLTAYTHFLRYLKQPKTDEYDPREGRCVERLAVQLGRAEHTLQENSRNHWWELRAAAWDAYRHQRKLQESQRMLSEASVDAAAEMLVLLRSSVRSHMVAGRVLDPVEIADVASAASQLASLGRE